MPISNETPSANLPLAVIRVADARQRREFDTSDLEFSLSRRGLIHPIVVRDNGDGTYLLIAGERRFRAAKNLGWDAIPARFADGLDQLELQLIELEENVKRQDLSWQDNMAAVEKIHGIYVSLDADWTRTATAEAIGLSLGHLSEFLAIAEAAKEKPELLGRDTIRSAYNVIARSNSRKQGEALEELFNSMKEAMEDGKDKDAIDEVKQAAEAKRAAVIASDDVLPDSFLDWAPSYAGPKFNLIHCDFPYGVGLFDKEFGQRGGARPYADTKDIYFALLNCLLDNLDKVMSLSGHLVFWYSMKYDRETKDLFAERGPSLDFMTHPFIWGKSDNTGIIGDARRDLRHTYEVALIARRGARHVVKSVADFYSAPSDRTLHPSTKPEPMLKHLFSSLVDEHTSLLDPTCGSGSALRAADALGATRVLGLEIDAEYADGARTALRNSRKLRLANVTTRSIL